MLGLGGIVVDITEIGDTGNGVEVIMLGIVNICIITITCLFSSNCEYPYCNCMSWILCSFSEIHYIVCYIRRKTKLADD